jgi:hypothetical protein
MAKKKTTTLAKKKNTTLAIKKNTTMANHVAAQVLYNFSFVRL